LLDTRESEVYALNVYARRRTAMPRTAIEGNSRVALRIRPADKALILRAVALAESDMTEFILRTALKEARSVIRQHERVKLTRRDSRLVLDLLENPPAPNARLRRVARAMPSQS
jgi:uncharacterized protein (DUF1778 family)